MRQNPNRTLPEWMALHADVLISHASPRFYLGRTQAGNICRVAHGVPERVTDRLLAVAKNEPLSDVPDGRPALADVYAEILSETTPVTREWLGPAYYFPEQTLTHSHEVVQIDSQNTHLLQPDYADWLPAVGKRDPVCVLLVEGEAVSICFSPAVSAVAHEAGVETLRTHRGHGYAACIVASWASLVRGLGIEPLYSTTSENYASQAVAIKLRLVSIGLDFHLT